ncbi:MAG: nuclear transport factor 2 family protein [Asgard group archaeon]|nr:nuclear transport factor 2 family protein [Asgard group archaeon]
MDSQEIVAITKLLDTYFEGNKEINSKKILSTWHKDAQIISTEKYLGMEGWVEFEEYYKKQIDNDMSKWDINFKIHSIDIFMNCAIVKVEVNYRVDQRKFDEIQYLNLLKDDNGWLIYSKIFKFY